tara:strand:- start:6743 stop:8209 length:1467 start_codon:yes stop_codon:yes gene_type:complete
MKELCFLFLLVSIIVHGQKQIGDDIEGANVDDLSGFSVSLSSDGNILAIGAPNNDLNGNNSGHVRVFQNQGAGWSQIGNDIEGEISGDSSGYDVSLSSDGSVVAIGAPYNDGNGNNSGHVRIFKNQSGVWTQLGKDIDGEAAGDQSGRSVSLSSNGSIVAIGAPSNVESGTQGHVRLYQNIDDNWVQIGEDIDAEALGDNNGWSVSLSSDGSIVAIGAESNDGNGVDAGHVRVYQNLGGVWTQIGQDIDGEAAGDRSGYSVSLSSDGSVVAIGAIFNDGNGNGSGHVRIYQNLGGVWTQIGQDIDGEAELDLFGWSVFLSSDGSSVAIGANHNNGNGKDSGHVRVYQNVAGLWNQIGTDIDGQAAGDQSGHIVSLSPNGNTLAIGSPHNQTNGEDSGHVRVFDLTAIFSSTDVILSNIMLYPNPSNHLINVSLEPHNKLEKINLYSPLGQLLYSGNRLKLDVSNLAKGNYYVEISTKEGKAVKMIIVK